ncbi:MAG: NADH dehydrogenase [Verrucomicrobia bacterium 61-8]|nr:NADH-quinone oxidoreductase subunit J [Verrucomicrobiota bacterium]OJV23069.1 MAG: NADH dehydrogenase [Verrucomicrobia bacterium 61-8]
MEVALFWIFAALMLGFGAAVIFLKSPVSSALSLVVSFLGLAALFLLLDAFFIGIIQVLVYAGAVMVLFLFIIMLLDLKTERARKLNIPALIGGLMVVVGFIALLVKLLPDFHIAKPALARPVNDVASVGMLLFSDYNLPFQIIGVLLLVATVGVVLLSRKELK